jgi:hypothetical protein
MRSLKKSFFQNCGEDRTRKGKVYTLNALGKSAWGPESKPRRFLPKEALRMAIEIATGMVVGIMAGMTIVMFRDNDLDPG